jgi:hypothetical protein
MASKKAEQVTQSFLGNQEELKEYISKGKQAQYAPEVEIFVRPGSEKLIAVVKVSEENLKLNPVYEIISMQVLRIVYMFADSTGGVLLFYKVPRD